MSENLISNTEGIMVDTPPTEELNEQPENQEEENKEKSPLSELLETLSEYEDSPDEEQLTIWKEIYGMYFASSVNGEDIYVWRTIKRLEYKSIAQSGAMEKQDLLENALIRKCLLWPKPAPDFLSSLDAGIIPTIFKQIMHKSGFVSDEMAISMIRRV
ncbi:hypothetical protein N9242_00925 [Vicingaceae bacterium]|nr:hypothetical protein [Vicingaceae bacterium]